MMTVDEAIAKAEQWRKEGACGPAGLVAIALLDELESARATMTKHEQEITALHAKLAGETLRADQGWQRYEAANKARIEADALLSKAIPEGYVVVPGWMPIESAPKVKNKEILLLVDGEPKAGYWWVQEYYEQRDSDGNYFDHVDYAEGWATCDGDFDVKPAGWTPLPAAPSVEGEGA